MTWSFSRLTVSVSLLRVRKTRWVLVFRVALSG